jgi:hypothetical protein
MISTRTIVLLTSFSTLAGLHIIAIKLSLYWHFWWFDIPMHFFGGVIVAIGLYDMSDLNLPVPPKLYRLLPFMLSVFVVTIVWECFELWAGIPIEHDFIVDTTTDFVMGLTGGLLGYIGGKRLADV